MVPTTASRMGSGNPQDASRHAPTLHGSRQKSQAQPRSRKAVGGPQLRHLLVPDGQIAARIILPISCKTPAVKALPPSLRPWFHSRQSPANRLPPECCAPATLRRRQTPCASLYWRNTGQQNEGLDSSCQNHRGIKRIGHFVAEAKKAELTNWSILADMTGSCRMRWATISREPFEERNSSVTWTKSAAWRATCAARA